MRKSDLRKVTIEETRLRKAIRNMLNEAVADQLDKEYLEAIQAKDLKKIRAMVQNAFKMAYPDNAIVDSNGDPMVLYHGTGNGDFTRFEHGHGDLSNDLADVGFWFTPDNDFASNFVDHGWRHEGKRIMSVYLVSSNPKVYTSVDEKEAEEAYNNVNQLKREAQDAFEHFVNKMPDVPYKRSIFRYVAKEELAALFNMTYDYYDRYYYDKLTPEQRAQVDQVAAEYKALTNKWRQAAHEYDIKYLYGDSYEKFRTELYKYSGQSSRDANFAGLGMSLDKPKEAKAAYLNDLTKDGYDSILIKNTRFDRSITGYNNDQYIVFHPNQIKSADLVTYDNQGNIIPLSQRFTNNDDIRYEE